jgi:hypothetical protein
MNRKQSDMLNACIKKLEGGSSLEDCFNQYPDLTKEMRATLQTITALLSVSVEHVPTEAINQSRTNLLAQVRLVAKDGGNRRTHSPAQQQNWLQRRRHEPASLSPIASRIGLILGMTLLLIILSGGLVITSAKSLPGDTLYPVKIAVEDIRVQLIGNQEVRNEYEINNSQQRVEEVRRLLALQRSQLISFEGVVQSIENNDHWIVDGITVQVSSATNYIGRLAAKQLIIPGVVIEVEGRTTNQGWVVANEIHLRKYQLQGKVEIINTSSWTIAGNPVNIISNTHIDEGIKVGDEVEVTVQSTDTAVVALAIHLVEQPTEIPETESTEIGAQGTDSASSPEDIAEGTSITAPEQPESISPTEEIYTQLTPGGDHESEYQVSAPQATPQHEEGDGMESPVLSQTPEPPEQQ